MKLFSDRLEYMVPTYIVVLTFIVCMFPLFIRVISVLFFIVVISGVLYLN